MPKVYDKDGRELTVGARAELVGGPVEATVLSAHYDRVYFQCDGSRMRAVAPVDLNSRRCHHLTLIDSPTEGKEG